MDYVNQKVLFVTTMLSGAYIIIGMGGGGTQQDTLQHIIYWPINRLILKQWSHTSEVKFIIIYVSNLKDTVLWIVMEQKL